MKKALVTEGTGVTGAALVRYLLNKGVSVTAVVRPGSSRRYTIPDNENLKIIECSLGDSPEYTFEQGIGKLYGGIKIPK
ncbi:MAG: GDP-mannose 4,6-dehydratase [Oscillospiraceae bacterium]|jgi:nucleoside-diphosphate-sugar epimerase|nr:GDP-mannose 4,6-dehydratase [Oscillospiraceae bacterium]